VGRGHGARKDVEDDIGGVDAVGDRLGAGGLDRRPRYGLLFRACMADFIDTVIQTPHWRRRNIGFGPLSYDAEFNLSK
jgi:hypothetical protein